MRLLVGSASTLQLTEQALDKHGTRTTGPHVVQRNKTLDTMNSENDKSSLFTAKHMWFAVTVGSTFLDIWIPTKFMPSSWIMHCFALS